MSEADPNGMNLVTPADAMRLLAAHGADPNIPTMKPAGRPRRGDAAGKCKTWSETAARCRLSADTERTEIWHPRGASAREKSMASVRLPRFVATLAVLVSVALGAAVAVRRTPAVHASSAAADIVRLAAGSAVHLATPPFLKVGKRYAFTWPGGGPPQTFIVKSIHDYAPGWILVEVADETIRPELYIPGEFPTRWLHVGLALSIQEMRPLP